MEEFAAGAPAASQPGPQVDVQALVEAVQRLQMVMQEQQNAIQQYEGRLAELRVLAQAQGRGGGPQENHRARLVDTRGIGKPPVFPGDMAKWPAWSFKMENFVASVYQEGRNALHWAATQEDPILQAEVDAIIENASEISEGLYSALAQLTEQEALDIVKNCPRGNGLEAWRRLTRRFDPQTVGRKRALLGKILAPGVSKMSDLSASIEQWEERVRQYQDRSRESLSEDVRAGILIEMAPEQLRTHLYLNQSRLESYDKVRAEIFSFLEAKYAKHTQDDPMDVGFVGKGDGGGKSSKGKGSKGNSIKGEKFGKGSMSSSFQGACFKCGKTGHRSFECRSGGQSSGSKGKSKSTKGPKGKGSGKSGDQKGKQSGAFMGYCSSCGRWGHRSRECRSSVNNVEGEDEDESGEPDEEIGGLMIGMVERRGARSSSRNHVGGPTSAGSSATRFRARSSSAGSTATKPVGAPDRLERIDIAVDSGAAVSAIGPQVCQDYPVMEHESSGRLYVAANGTRITDLGRRTPSLWTDDGQVVSAGFSVTNVRRPLLSVSQAVSKGMRIVFDSESNGGSWMECKKTGRRMKLEQRNGIFVMRAWVVPYSFTKGGSQDAREIAAYEKESPEHEGEAQDSSIGRRSAASSSSSSGAIPPQWPARAP